VQKLSRPDRLSCDSAKCFPVVCANSVQAVLKVLSLHLVGRGGWFRKPTVSCYSVRFTPFKFVGTTQGRVWASARGRAPVRLSLHGRRNEIWFFENLEFGGGPVQTRANTHFEEIHSIRKLLILFTPLRRALCIRSCVVR